ncbi:MAG: hypothetical protein K2W82_04500 [Candidatus Obscuribacterales bacterium]|jgi:hypothetical protein|nr:hypothetical protein [Candidatus Obscuribacterales bacterium]
MKYDTENERRYKWRKNLLKLALFSWLMMGILLGVHCQRIFNHFLWLFWLAFAASASGTLVLAIVKENSPVNNRLTEERSIQKIS